MFALTIVGFGLLLAVTWRAGGALLFPPTLLAASWLACLAGIGVWGGFLFPVQPIALAVYLAGAVAFAVGGVAVLALWPPEATSEAPRSPQVTLRALDVLLVILVLGLPLFWEAMTEGMEGVDPAFLLVSIRAVQVELSDQRRSVSPVANLAVIAQFAAMAMYFESDGSASRRWRAAVAVLLALAYGAMSGTKGNAVTLLLSLVFVTSLQNQRVQLRVMTGFAAGALAIFSAGIMLVNRVTFEIADVGAAAEVVIEEVLVYWLGGAIAFGELATSAHTIVATAPLNRFFLESARSLGMAVEVPPKHAEFTAVSPDLDTNVYTAYFTYFTDHGWVVMVAILFLLGVALAFTYRAALRRGPVATLVYASLSVGVVLSVLAEFHFVGLNQFIKFVVFLLLVYRVLPMLGRPHAAPSAT